MQNPSSQRAALCALLLPPRPRGGERLPSEDGGRGPALGGLLRGGTGWETRQARDPGCCPALRRQHPEAGGKGSGATGQGGRQLSDHAGASGHGHSAFPPPAWSVSPSPAHPTLSRSRPGLPMCPGHTGRRAAGAAPVLLGPWRSGRCRHLHSARRAVNTGRSWRQSHGLRTNRVLEPQPEKSLILMVPTQKLVLRPELHLNHGFSGRA